MDTAPEGVRKYFTFTDSKIHQPAPQNQTAFWDYEQLQGLNRSIVSENKFPVDRTKTYKVSIDIRHVEGQK